MSVNVEYCDPFSGDEQDIWMKLEHCGRYMFARDYLAEMKCESVIDLAASNGYGSKILSEKIPAVTAADRNAEYLDSGYLRGESGIRIICFDFDAENYPEEMQAANAVVCFETIEHLRNPYAFLKKIANYILPGGWLLLSFPNALFEVLKPDGTNMDPYHLHVLDYAATISELERTGFCIHDVLGQPVSNDLCTRQHDLKVRDALISEEIDRAFRYDKRSIRALAQLIAWPQKENLEKSYSYIVVAQKNS